MDKKKGRPISYKTDDIMLIIDQYVRYTEGRSLISASEVARFANEYLHISNFKYYVIQRNPETKQYLANINKRIKECTITERGTAVSVFKTLNINAMLQMNKEELGQVLTNLNIVLEDMADKQSKLIQENLQLSRQCVDLKAEIEHARKDLQELWECGKSKTKGKDDTISHLKAKIATLEKAVRIAWDEEAETILKNQGIFENDGTPINNDKTITDPTFDLRLIANPIEANSTVTTDDAKVIDMRKSFLEGLNKI